MIKLDPCFSGGSFKGGTIFVGGFKVFIALIVFLVLAIYVDFLYPENTAGNKNINEETRNLTLIILEVLDILFGILLIIGAIKSRTDLLMSWIVYTIAYCCLAAAGLIILISTRSVSSKTVAGLVVTEAIHVYFLLIVNSLRLEIKEKRNEQIMVYKTMPPEPEKC